MIIESKALLKIWPVYLQPVGDYIKAQSTEEGVSNTWHF